MGADGRRGVDGRGLVFHWVRLGDVADLHGVDGSNLRALETRLLIFHAAKLLNC